jgi:F-type H+-transporting ATPase subunit alpha
VWAGTQGKLDDIPVAEIRRFESEFLGYLRHQHQGTLNAIADGTWDDDIVNQLDQAIEHFKQMFLGKEPERRVNEPPAQPMSGEEARETVTRFRDSRTDRPVENEQG